MRADRATLELVDRLEREGRCTVSRARPVEAWPVPVDDGMAEKEFMQAVIDEAKCQGWRCFHVFDSRRSAAGWPDVFMVRGKRAIAAELKTNAGRLTAAQSSWLEDLAAAGIETHCWRPADWSSLVALLRADAVSPRAKPWRDKP